MGFRTILIIAIFLTLILACENKPNDLNTSVDPHYLDPYRPQIHYSRDTSWLSDPNGLFYLNGEWHLMFQGFSNRPGMYLGTNWDHAVSKNMLNWQHLPTVLPGGKQVSYYSGCAVVDLENVSGLGQDDTVPVLAFYTTHFMGNHPENPNRNDISIAYSTDGKSWKYGNIKVVENPEFPHERDPSVFWHPESEKWIMATAGTGRIRFYSSRNLIDWTYESSALPYPSWECPDLSMIEVEETGESKVLLITSTNGGVPNSTHGTAYHIGSFDGSVFHPEDTSHQKNWLDWGSDFYAGITYSNAPDNRVLFQSWFGWPAQFHKAYAPTSKYSGSMNLIRELTLHKSEERGYYIKSNPINEYKKLRIDSTLFSKFTLSNRKTIRKNIGSHDPIELIIELKVEKNATFGVRLKNDFGEDYIFKYDDWHQQFIGDRTMAGTHPRHYSKNYNDLSRMPYQASSGKIKLRIYWDVSTFEVFVDDGTEAFSQLIYPREPFNTVELFSSAGNSEINSLVLYDLESIWKE